MKQMSVSQQIYLKTILRMEQKKTKVRSVDIAKELGYTRPSVCNAITRLRNAGLVEEKDGTGIKLTALGREKAWSFTERSAVIASFFQKIGAEESLAQETAYGIEHILPDALLDIIRENLNQ